MHLNHQCRSDIAWCLTFIQEWNGVAFFPNPRAGPMVVSDMSGMWGCGAFACNTHEWFLEVLYGGEIHQYQLGLEAFPCKEGAEEAGRLLSYGQGRDAVLSAESEVSVLR